MWYNALHSPLWHAARHSIAGDPYTCVHACKHECTTGRTMYDSRLGVSSPFPAKASNRVWTMQQLGGSVSAESSSGHTTLQRAQEIGRAHV